MRVNMRREARSASVKTYLISWRDVTGCGHSVQVEGLNLSPSGIGIRCPVEFPIGATLHVVETHGTLSGECMVRHCSLVGTGYLIGLEQDEATKKTGGVANVNPGDYYNFLQISANAENETIHRVYRFLASRFHPDNPETGDPEKFLLLKRAFETLSDPERRAAYDASLGSHAPEPLAAMEHVDFLDGIEGEVNRRLGVLSVLYERRRVNAEHPHVSLAELESRMGLPREYLDFTTWYLKSKKYITREDNSDFALTALGVDYIEANYSTTPMLKRLLAAAETGAEPPHPHPPPELEVCEAGNSASDLFAMGPETERKRIERNF